MDQTRTYTSQVDPAISIQVKRISLRERFRFVEQSFDWIQRLQFLNAKPDLTRDEIASVHEIETNLTRLILNCVWSSWTTAAGTQLVSDELVEQLIHEAPAELCCEIVALCGDQISLSDVQRKKSLPPSTTSGDPTAGSAAAAEI